MVLSVVFKLISSLHYFIDERSPARLEMFLASKFATYINDDLKQRSAIDYILTSCRADSVDYDVIDLDTNFLDNLPIVGIFTYANSSLNRLSRDESDIAA
jgi:hypothetical protein